jgi:hypothetical protein
MAGFNFTPPPGPMAPMANLAQLAQASFRPPPMMNMPGMPGMAGMPAVQQAPGFNVQDGLDKLASGVLAALKGMAGSVTPSGPQGTGPGGTYTQADAMSMFNGANAGVPFVDPANFSPAASFVGGGMPGGLSQQDFLTGAWRTKTGLDFP